MATNEQNIWKELRKPFPAGTVGKLPKPYKKDSPKGKCNECGGYHGLPAVHLDYVGHAAITDRLNTVDPTWTWEPAALDPQGSPALDREGNLWIKLTVGGVTRLGVGDGSNMKERIGDALRNAAMRFGVALDLWTEDELESHLESPELKNAKPSTQATPAAPTAAPDAPDAPENELPSTLTAEQVAELLQLAKAKGYTDKALAVKFLNEQSGLPDFTNTPEAEFAGLKKVVIESGWAKDAA